MRLADARWLPDALDLEKRGDMSGAGRLSHIRRRINVVVTALADYEPIAESRTPSRAPPSQRADLSGRFTHDIALIAFAPPGEPRHLMQPSHTKRKVTLPVNELSVFLAMHVDSITLPLIAARAPLA